MTIFASPKMTPVLNLDQVKSVISKLSSHDKRNNKFKEKFVEGGNSSQVETKNFFGALITLFTLLFTYLRSVMEEEKIFRGNSFMIKFDFTVIMHV